MKTPYRCNNCGQWLGEAAFETKFCHAACLRTRVCRDCEERRPCKSCQEPKAKTEFSAGEWILAGKTDPKRGSCADCAKRTNGFRVCTGPKCQKILPSEQFSTWLDRGAPGHARCNDCFTPQRKRGVWICIDVGCKEEKPVSEFSLWLARRSQRKNNGTARCNVCFRREEETRRTSIREAAETVVRGGK